ncbi:hypothetical protein Avbf_15224 [Armadillidium vulgare]|nr:hypothetical protein Avbf_15224 [Armadillidium vulgare]
MEKFSFWTLEQDKNYCLMEPFPTVLMFHLRKLNMSFLKLTKNFKPNADNLVISSKGGERALQAWRILNEFGYCSSRVYYGSFKDWVRKNGPILKL